MNWDEKDFVVASLQDDYYWSSLLVFTPLNSPLPHCFKVVWETNRTQWEWWYVTSNAR